MTVALRLAEFLVERSTANLPPQTLDHAAMLIASTIASAAFGKDLESARIVRELANEHGGRPDSTVWFAGNKLPIADAAQVNAVMSDGAASDDSDLRNIVHLGTPLTTASLAMAEHRVECPLCRHLDGTPSNEAAFHLLRHSVQPVH